MPAAVRDVSANIKLLGSHVQRHAPSCNPYTKPDKFPRTSVLLSSQSPSISFLPFFCKLAPIPRPPLESPFVMLLRLFHPGGAHTEDSGPDGPNNGGKESSKRRRRDTSWDDEQTADDRRDKRACQWDSDDDDEEDDWDKRTLSESEVELVVERVCQYMSALQEGNENSRGQDGEMGERGEENQASEGGDPSDQKMSSRGKKSGPATEVRKVWNNHAAVSALFL